MILIEELRKGNRICNAYNRAEEEVVRVTVDKNVIITKSYHRKQTWVGRDHNFDPVPITKRHLIDLNFEKTHHDKFKSSYWHKDLSIEVLLSNVNKTDNMVFGSDKLLKIDMKLHQLQNLITDLS